MQKQRGRRGQLQISFGMIFSIIIIVATLAVASYVLVKFVDFGSRVSCKLFYRDLQERIDRAWAEDGKTSDIFKGKMPHGVEKVCLGSISENAAVYDKAVQEELKFYADKDSNLFFYPPEKSACGSDGFVYSLVHASTNNFFCIPVVDGKVELKISKSSTENLVTLKS